MFSFVCYTYHSFVTSKKNLRNGSSNVRMTSLWGCYVRATPSRHRPKRHCLCHNSIVAQCNGDRPGRGAGGLGGGGGCGHKIWPTSAIAKQKRSQFAVRKTCTRALSPPTMCPHTFYWRRVRQICLIEQYFATRTGQIRPYLAELVFQFAVAPQPTAVMQKVVSCRSTPFLLLRLQGRFQKCEVLIIVGFSKFARVNMIIDVNLPTWNALSNASPSGNLSTPMSLLLMAIETEYGMVRIEGGVPSSIT